MGNCCTLKRNLYKVFLSVLNALADSVRHLARFSETVSYDTVAVADNNESRKLHNTAALYGFGNAVDGNHALL